MLDSRRHLFKELEKTIAKVFSPLPITPNQYTLIAFLSILVTLYFLIKQNIILAIIFFFIAGFLDLVDGAVARHKNMVTKTGAYLDTIVDRYIESILLLGMLFLPLPEIFLPAYIWIFLVLFGSVMTTYAKAAAKEKNLVDQEMKGGLLSRGERIILLVMALTLTIFNITYAVYVLIILAVLSNFTALQRINSGVRLSIRVEKK
ncbi:CDP-alcohol phosphatidyltransferase family protein [Candidatus Parcubacteria bacterium]|nr:CDP-alcohol phosphatidyltransferase family protein [Candidatus Parcubacteria bacterium]